MSKELEALEKLKDRANHDEYLFRKDTDKEKALSFLKENSECIEIIEKELKAFEIIRYKNISIECLKRAIRKEGLEWYNHLCPYPLERLSQEEYDLLTEVLSDGQ